MADDDDALAAVRLRRVDGDEPDGLRHQVDKRSRQVGAADLAVKAAAAETAKVDGRGVGRQRADGTGDDVGQAQIGAVAVAGQRQFADFHGVERAQQETGEAEHGAAAYATCRRHGHSCRPQP